MIPSIDVLRETILQGIENGIFAYAEGADGKFQMVKIGTRLESDMIEFDENSFLLKPEEAYRLIGAPSPPGSEIGGGKQVGVGQGGTEPAPTRGRGPEPDTYDEVIIVAEQLDWKKW